MEMSYEELTSSQQRRYDIELSKIEYEKAITDAKFNYQKAKLDFSWGLIPYEVVKEAESSYEKILEEWSNAEPSITEALGYYQLDDLGIEY